MHRGVLAVEILALAIASLGARNGSVRVPASRVSGILVVKSPPRTIRFKGWSADNRQALGILQRNDFYVRRRGSDSIR
jgi:hypothetical protein